MPVKTQQLCSTDLNETVQLWSRGTPVVDAFGQASIVWVSQGSYRAQVQPIRGREVFAAMQVQAQASVKVRIRFKAGIDATWRLTWQGVHHDIISSIPVGRKLMTEILCLPGVKDGR